MKKKRLMRQMVYSYKEDDYIYESKKTYKVDDEEDDLFKLLGA